MDSYILPAALVLYIIGIALAVVGTVYRWETSRKLSIVAFALAWAVQLLSIVRHGMNTGGFPITNRAEFLLVLSWVILTMFLVVWLRWRMHALALLLPPIAALAGVASLQFVPAGQATPERPGWFQFHTSLSTVGLAILCLAFAMALIYLAQDRALKSKRKLRLIERLPSLESSDRIGLFALALGFLLLSLGIAAGVGYNWRIHKELYSAEYKQTFSLMAWVVFAVVLFSRTALGFRGRKSAYLTIAGFTLGLLTVIGMHL